jgi:hypothetical protein
MKKVFGSYEVELTGSMIMVKVNGELRGAKEVNPLNAVEKYEEICKVYEKRSLELVG